VYRIINNAWHAYATCIWSREMRFARETRCTKRSESFTFYLNKDG